MFVRESKGARSVCSCLCGAHKSKPPHTVSTKQQHTVLHWAARKHKHTEKMALCLRAPNFGCCSKVAPKVSLVCVCQLCQKVPIVRAIFCPQLLLSMRDLNLEFESKFKLRPSRFRLSMLSTILGSKPCQAARPNWNWGPNWPSRGGHYVRPVTLWLHTVVGPEIGIGNGEFHRSELKGN